MMENSSIVLCCTFFHMVVVVIQIIRCGLVRWVQIIRVLFLLDFFNGAIESSCLM
jgi:hypothetical protein